MELMGIPASPGSAAGSVFVVGEPPAQTAVSSTGMEGVRQAMARAAAGFEELAARVRERSPQGAAVLEAQALLAQDETVEAEVREGLDGGGDAITAVWAAYEKHAAQLEAPAGDSYLGARAADLREVGRAIVDALTGRPAGRLLGLTSPAFVIAHDLAPADTLSVAPELLLGIVTEVGGATSHAAIVARELAVPAVLSVNGAVAAASGARSAAVDGGSGTVRFSPEPAVESSRGTASATAGSRLPEAWLPLCANAGSIQTVVAAARRGAQGVGLLRTELFYLGRATAPTEEEQVAFLRDACAAMSPYPVVLRTLEAGSDKALPYVEPRREPNPALGARGVRLWLAHPELAVTQVRAILRAQAEHGNLRVMLPMVAARSEVEAARALFVQEGDSLGLQLPPLGIMVETPAAAIALPSFEGVVEFVSLGTNDLSQYAAGADRELSWQEDLREWNPGTLRLIQRALLDARALGLEAGACGELAGSPAGSVLLAGLGATSLSMSAGSLDLVAQALRALGRDGCIAAAQAALAERTAAGARSAVETRLPAPLGADFT